MSDNLTIDLQDLTLDEIDLMEDILDGPFDQAAKPGARKAKFLRACAVVGKHREDPEGYPVGTAEERAATSKRVGTLKINLATPDAEGNASEPSA